MELVVSLIFSVFSSFNRFFKRNLYRIIRGTIIGIRDLIDFLRFSNLLIGF